MTYHFGNGFDMQLGSMTFHMRMGIISEILLFVLHKVTKKPESVDTYCQCTFNQTLLLVDSISCHNYHCLSENFLISDNAFKEKSPIFVFFAAIRARAPPEIVLCPLIPTPFRHP